ncbi:dephospho-CoA kinase [Flavobacteriaceae sp. LMIT009]
MCKVVGLTGGIGSGKTTVAKMFEELGVPIYIADIEAKKLINRSKIIKRKLIVLFGDEAYVDNKINRVFVAGQIFNNKDLLSRMNQIVHPKVASHFKRWLKKHNSPFVIKEAAILFENGSYKDLDAIITVTAPIEERIKRVTKRDNSTKEKVLAVMRNQWDDKKKVELSDYVINNTTLEKTQEQVLKIHEDILKKFG